MGRMLETFRSLLKPVAVAAVNPDEQDDRPSEASADEVEVPYIEIGPRRHVEGSPSVMAAPAPTSGIRLPGPPGVQFRGLPAVPRSRLAPELVAYHAPGQPASAEYANLLDTLLEAAQRDPKQACKTLLFTAVRPGVGSTTVLLNLAITAARQDCKVIVVDANLRRPAVAGRLGMEGHPGLTEVLAGDLPLADAVRPTVQEGLRVLTAGAPAVLWADLGVIRGLVDDLANDADLVLIDGPSWDGKGAATTLARSSGAMFLVVPAGEADTPPTSELVRSLPGQGISLAGCVLTSNG